MTPSKIRVRVIRGSDSVAFPFQQGYPEFGNLAEHPRGDFTIKIRTKLLLVQEIVLVVFLVLVVWLVSAMVNDLYETQERFIARDNMDRVLLGIDREAEEMRLLAWDYATWDDAYEFMQTHDQAFIDEHLDDPAFTEFRFHAVYFFDCKGKTVWGKALHHGEEGAIMIPEFVFAPRERLKTAIECPTDWVEGKPYKGASGVYMTSHGTMIIAVQPVTTSLYMGPPRGMLLMARFFDENAKRDLAEQTRVAFAALPVNTLSEDDKELVQRLLETGKAEINELSDDILRISGLEKNINGEPALLLRVDIPRHLMATAKLSMRFLILSVLLGGCVIVLVAYYATERIVSVPLRKTIGKVRMIAEGGEPQGPLPTEKVDELGELNLALNKLLERLQDEKT